MKEIQVSVAVITYNMEKYLGALLDSILKQRVEFEFEIVINDDCSPDCSRDIIANYMRKYPDVIKTVYLDHNVGGSNNMFHVLQNCAGRYIAILEGDDFWEDENKLQYQFEFLECHPEYIGMTCNSWCEHGEAPVMKELMRKRTEPKVFSYNDFLNRHFHDRLPTSTDTWMFRNIFKTYPNEDYSVFFEAHKMIWDQSLILILYGKGKIYADPKVVSHHRSISSKEGTNYQSMIIQKNALYEDSFMYRRMEEYIENILRRDCKKFYLVRGDVWVDAIFRAMLTKKTEDWKISEKIWKDQNRKLMLIRLFLSKCINIGLRKIGVVR